MSLFDGDKALGTIKDSESHSMLQSIFLERHQASLLSNLRFIILEHVSDVITKNTVLLQNLRESVEKHLNNCGRRWVDLKTIFSLIKI
jgi:hypothetical protein